MFWGNSVFQFGWSKVNITTYIQHAPFVTGNVIVYGVLQDQQIVWISMHSVLISNCMFPQPCWDCTAWSSFQWFSAHNCLAIESLFPGGSIEKERIWLTYLLNPFHIIPHLWLASSVNNDGGRNLVPCAVAHLNLTEWIRAN